jgi:hypothetical protein
MKSSLIMGTRPWILLTEYDYEPGYYAVFFADPDGMKLELVHVPMRDDDS